MSVASEATSDLPGFNTSTLSLQVSISVNLNFFLLCSQKEFSNQRRWSISPSIARARMYVVVLEAADNSMLLQMRIILTQMCN